MEKLDQYIDYDMSDTVSLEEMKKLIPMYGENSLIPPARKLSEIEEDAIYATVVDDLE